MCRGHQRGLRLRLSHPGDLKSLSPCVARARALAPPLYSSCSNHTSLHTQVHLRGAVQRIQDAEGQCANRQPPDGSSHDPLMSAQVLLQVP